MESHAWWWVVNSGGLSLVGGRLPQEEQEGVLWQVRLGRRGQGEEGCEHQPARKGTVEGAECKTRRWPSS